MDNHFASLKKAIRSNRGDEKKIAQALARPVRDFVNTYYQIEDSIEGRLAAFFSDVSGFTGERRDYRSEKSHTHLLANWEKNAPAGSKTFAIATYVYLHTRQGAREIVESVNEQVFSCSSLELAKGDQVGHLLRSCISREISATFHRDGPNWKFPRLIKVGPGIFNLGSEQSEYDRDSSESPVIPTEISRPFFLGQYPITRGEYAEFVEECGHPDGAMYVWQQGNGWTERPDFNWRQPGFTQSDDHPVVGVSFNDAERYCKWMSEITGHTYRLPGEDEWEYACRADTDSAFSFGEDINPNLARYDHREPYFEEGRSTSDFLYGTAPVHSFTPNAWGFYQMHGNVWEWCSDPWVDNYRSRKAKRRSPLTVDHSRAVVRGGGWLSSPNKLRSAKRDWDGKNLRGDTIGFRILREII